MFGKVKKSAHLRSGISCVVTIGSFVVVMAIFCLAPHLMAGIYDVIIHPAIQLFIINFALGISTVIAIQVHSYLQRNFR